MTGSRSQKFLTFSGLYKLTGDFICVRQRDKWPRCTEESTQQFCMDYRVTSDLEKSSVPPVIWGIAGGFTSCCLALSSAQYLAYLSLLLSFFCQRFCQNTISSSDVRISISAPPLKLSLVNLIFSSENMTNELMNMDLNKLWERCDNSQHSNICHSCNITDIEDYLHMRETFNWSKALYLLYEWSAAFFRVNTSSSTWAVYHSIIRDKQMLCAALICKAVITSENLDKRPCIARPILSDTTCSDLLSQRPL